MIDVDPRDPQAPSQAQEIVNFLLTHGQVYVCGKENKLTLDLLTRSKKNGFIASSLRSKDSNLSISLVMLPKPEHVPSYYLAGTFSKKDGPSDVYPGSIGVLKLEVNLENSTAKLVELQSSVRHQKAKVITQLAKNQSQPKLSTYYYHWQNDLMQLALDYLNKLHILSLIHI